MYKRRLEAKGRRKTVNRFGIPSQKVIRVSDRYTSSKDVAGRLGYTLIEQSHLPATTGDLLDCSHAEVFKSDGVVIGTESPLVVCGFYLYPLHFLREINVHSTQ
jgi:hypothetical protein